MRTWLWTFPITRYAVERKRCVAREFPTRSTVGYVLCALAARIDTNRAVRQTDQARHRIQCRRLVVLVRTNTIAGGAAAVRVFNLITSLKSLIAPPQGILDGHRRAEFVE